MNLLCRLVSRHFFSTLIVDTKCSSSSSSISKELISSKCDYVKALYGYGSSSSVPQASSSYECRMRQAATVALQNYLHFRRGVPLDDAVFISSGAPGYAQSLVQGMMMNSSTTGQDQEEGPVQECNMNYEQVRSRAESLMQKEGVDEMEPFLESIGLTPSSSDVEVVGELCGEQGLLRTAKALESRGIPKKCFWNLLRHNHQVLNYSLRDCLDALGMLHDYGLTIHNVGDAVRNCPWAFRVELEEEMRPVVEQLQRIGLDRSIIGRIILEAPSKVDALRSVNMDALVSAIQEIGVSREATLRILQADPIVVVGSSIAKLMQLMKYLKSVLLMEEDEIVSLITRFPRLLVLSLDKSVVAKVEYLKKQLGVDRAFIKNILLKTPQVLAFSLDDNLKPKVEFLESIGFKRRNLAMLLTRCPALLNDIVSNCLRRKANFLLHEGVPSTRLADLFYTYPQFVGLKLEEVRPRLEFFRKIVKVDYHSLGIMIIKHPAIMGYDTEKRVKPVLDYLKRRLALNALQTVQFLRERPSVVGAGVESVEEKVQYFENLGFRRGSDAFNEILAYGLAVPKSFMDSRLEKLRKMGISEAQLRKLIQIRMPLLYRDDQRMLSSTQYLIKDMNLSMEFLLKFPQFFGYSLEERIRPRHRLVAFLKEKHILRQDYPPAYMHYSRYRFEELFLDCHPEAQAVYKGGMPQKEEDDGEDPLLLPAEFHGQ